MLPAGGTAQLYAEDFLGSSRIVTSNTGVVRYDADFTPYGGERTVTNSCPQNNYKFEGKERDTETGNDDFGARYYSWRFGRWLSSDWSSVPIPVPYANLANPQTLNLYAMVADDPESSADLDGHCCEEAMELGEQLVQSGNPVSELVGGIVIGGALIGAALTNPTVRETVVDIATGQNGFGNAYPSYYHGGLQGQDGSSVFLKSGNNTSDKVPNPDGSKGKPDHQEQVQQDREELQKEAGEGESVPPSGTKIQGRDSNRRPDNQIVDKNGSTRKVVERERKPNSKRNKEREKEYNNVGVQNETRPVQPAPQPPAPKPSCASESDKPQC